MSASKINSDLTRAEHSKHIKTRQRIIEAQKRERILLLRIISSIVLPPIILLAFISADDLSQNKASEQSLQLALLISSSFAF